MKLTLWPARCPILPAAPALDGTLSMDAAAPADGAAPGVLTLLRLCRPPPSAPSCLRRDPHTVVSRNTDARCNQRHTVRIGAVLVSHSVRGQPAQQQTKPAAIAAVSGWRCAAALGNTGMLPADFACGCAAAAVGCCDEAAAADTPVACRPERLFKITVQRLSDRPRPDPQAAMLSAQIQHHRREHLLPCRQDDVVWRRAAEIELLHIAVLLMGIALCRCEHSLCCAVPPCCDAW